jgi:hypothetical protein
MKEVLLDALAIELYGSSEPYISLEELYSILRIPTDTIGDWARRYKTFLVFKLLAWDASGTGWVGQAGNVSTDPLKPDRRHQSCSRKITTIRSDLAALDSAAK